MGGNQGVRELHLGEKDGSQSRNMERKNQLHSEGRQISRRASKQNLLRRRKHERVKGPNSFPGGS